MELLLSITQTAALLVAVVLLMACVDTIKRIKNSLDEALYPFIKLSKIMKRVDREMEARAETEVAQEIEALRNQGVQFPDFGNPVDPKKARASTIKRLRNNGVKVKITKGKKTQTVAKRKPVAKRKVKK